VRAFECYLDALGAALAAQVLAYEPHVIVFGGGLSEISELTDAIPAALARHLFAGVAMPEIKLAEFGATSGGRGAAIAVLQHIHASAH
jgi:N-acetylglucosamine kinase